MNFLTATKGTRGRAIAQVTVRPLFTTGTQIQFRDNSRVTCDGLSGTGTGLFWAFTLSPLSSGQVRQS
jgi:hypothetical protein